MVHQAYQHLRHEIFAGHLAPMEKINIARTVEATKLSLASVREALARLESEGLVTAETNKGFRVAPRTLAELDDLTSTRIMIECACLENAIHNGGLDWESAIVSARFALSRTPLRAADGTTMNPDWAEKHAQFHAALVAGCNSAWLLRIRETLYAHSERYRVATMGSDSTARRLEEEHDALAEAVLARDAPRAVAAMRDHLDRTRKILIDSQQVSAAQ